MSINYINAREAQTFSVIAAEGEEVTVTSSEFPGENIRFETVRECARFFGVKVADVRGEIKTL